MNSDLRKLIMGGPNQTGVKTSTYQIPEKVDITDNSGISPMSKKIKKSKPIRDKNIKIKYIGYPVKLTTNEKCRRRYSCEVRYEDNQGKNHTKHVRFGNEGKNEFIDHGDNIKRLNTVSKLSHTDDLLHSNFYKMYLLNSNNTDMNVAYINLINELGLSSSTK